MHRIFTHSMDSVQGMYAKVAALRTLDARNAATLQKRATVCGSPFLFLFRLFGLLNNLNKNLSGAPTAIFTDDDELPWCAGRILLVVLLFINVHADRIRQLVFSAKF